MDLEFLENESSNGSASGSNGGGGSGGNDTSGSGGSVSGNSGNVSGDSGNVSGDSGNASGSATGSADTIGGISDSQQSSGINGADRSEDRSANGNRGSRAERERERRSVRLGDFRNRDSDASSADDRAGSASEIVDTSNVIRLGNIGRGRKPKEKVNTEQSAGNFKVSDVKDYVNVFLTSIFEIPAIALKQDFWKLEKEEAKQLTGAICDYLDSLPKSDSSKIAAFIQRHFPLINLAMVAFYIVSDRVRQSIAIAQVTKHGNAFAQAVASGNGQSTTASSGVRTPLDDIVH